MQVHNIDTWDFMCKLASYQMDGAEMTVTIIFQMLNVPMAIITPNYIWRTHDIPIPKIPLIVLLNRHGQWYATGKLMLYYSGTITLCT